MIHVTWLSPGPVLDARFHPDRRGPLPGRTHELVFGRWDSSGNRGIYLIAVPMSPLPSPLFPGPSEKRHGISLILIAFLLWTISISLLKLGLEGSTWSWPTDQASCCLPASYSFGIWLETGRPFLQIFGPGDIVGGLFRGAFLRPGGYLFLLAISMPAPARLRCSPAVLPSSAYPFRPLPQERVTARILCGTGLVVGGIFFLL